MGALQPMHLLIILIIVLMIFGAGKLPEVGSALGRGIKEFKKATNEEEKLPPPAATTTVPPSAAPAASTVPSAAASEASAPSAAATSGPAAPIATGPYCPKCGTRAASDSRFCASCGASLPTVAA